MLTVSSMPQSVRLKGGKTLTKCKAFDGDRSVTLIFFNRPFVKDVLYTGATYRFWGKLGKSKYGFELSPSTIEQVSDGKNLSSIVAVYPLTKGITQGFLRSLIMTALISISFDDTVDPIPEKIREELSVCTQKEAFYFLHDPKNEHQIKSGRDRFMVEELLGFACAVTIAKKSRVNALGTPFDAEKSKLYDFTDALPFKLTKAQARVISEIRKDLVSPYPMARLVAGDVGSGKTVCAMAAAYIAIKNGYQCAMMAPTEILAMQHYRDFTELFAKLGYECAYLTAATPAAQKRKTLERLANGELKLVVGTHALLSDKVKFSNLGLVITDEQHRFGVAQRSGLQEKGVFPHVLVMSATPIPRTLALILMGDLDISSIDELPPGRQSVDTLVVGEQHRERLNGFIEKQIGLGRQVYIVCPTVDVSEDVEQINENDLITFDFSETDQLPKLKSAVQYEQELRTKIFPEFKTAFIHGRMSGKEKDQIMEDFACGKIDILVSTTVIEVGVNVPNATLMIVENAERFGLSQLHQLRGRVGRGEHKSYCVLVSDAEGQNARKRLDIMKNNSNGYKIAQMDLEIRGPGDFISGAGAKQHGTSGNMKLAGFCSDSLLLDKVFRIASDIIDKDPMLSCEEYASLKSLVESVSGMGILGLN